MREGALALIDCLGWKGIWQGIDESVLIAKLDMIQVEVKAEVDKINCEHHDLSYGSIEAQIRLISDTVAVSIQYENDVPLVDDITKAYLVRTASLSVVRIQRLFLDREPRIVLRGCISYGNHLVVSNFIIGPAVDEAAAHYELAEGAFVWLLPSAGVPYNYANLLLHDIGSLLILYNMPLKGGTRLKSLVINPLYLENSTDRRNLVSIAFLQSMGRVNRLDVWLKRQNTMDFLEEAELASAQFEKTIKGLNCESDRSPQA